MTEGTDQIIGRMEEIVTELGGTGPFILIVHMGGEKTRMISNIPTDAADAVLIQMVSGKNRGH